MYTLNILTLEVLATWERGNKKNNSKNLVTLLNYYFVLLWSSEYSNHHITISPEQHLTTFITSTENLF